MENRLVVVTSPNTWIALRVLFESGEYPSLYVLYNKNWRKFPDMPSLTDLRKRCQEECWDKDRFTEVKTEVKRRSLVQLYAKLGMGEEQQARYRISCVKAVDDIRNIIGKLYRTLNNLDPADKSYTETLGKIKVLTDTMFKGMGVSLAALQEIGRVTGEQGPEKERRTNGKHEMDDMTEEEILQDLKRMKAAGIDIAEIEELKTSSDERKRPNEP